MTRAVPTAAAPRPIGDWRRIGTDSAPRRSEFRFYEELNDFLPPGRRKRSFTHAFAGTPSVKDQIEALGVPHTEVDLVLIDGESVDFARRLHGGERVAVYPMFERFELAGVTRLRPRPLREPRFVLDVHLGKLAAYLRLLGFDALYRNDYRDAEIVRIARAERRIVLSRDVGLLKRATITHGAFLHATDPCRQLREVIDRFQLQARIAPFSRCARCNGRVAPVAREQVLDAVPVNVARTQQRFHRCRDCGQVYWRGSHLTRMRRRLAAAGIQVPAAPGEERP